MEKSTRLFRKVFLIRCLYLLLVNGALVVLLMTDFSQFVKWGASTLVGALDVFTIGYFILQRQRVVKGLQMPSVPVSIQFQKHIVYGGEVRRTWHTARVKGSPSLGYNLEVDISFAAIPDGILEQWVDGSMHMKDQTPVLLVSADGSAIAVVGSVTNKTLI